MTRGTRGPASSNVTTSLTGSRPASSTSRSSRTSRRNRGGREERTVRSKRDSAGLRFYLNRTDPIVDAPSIGPRTATKLKKLGITTVDEFLTTKATEIASKLSDSRITLETINDWQAQTILACRIPQLRGHDAQILVACGISDPEKLAGMDAKLLWSQVGPFAKSADGKRIIRGGKAPDLAEVTDWIAWSKDCAAAVSNS